MKPAAAPKLEWLTEPDLVDTRTRDAIRICWRDVSNAGGAVGFPHPPVTDEHVQPAVDALVAGLRPGQSQLLVATIGGSLAGWLQLTGNDAPAFAHWGKVLRVQTALPFRGHGIGRALMVEVARTARDDLEWFQLHLEVRSGMGLEDFYRSSGWQEIGIWPNALRLGENDYRDEVLMLLQLHCNDRPTPATH